MEVGAEFESAVPVVDDTVPEPVAEDDGQDHEQISGFDHEGEDPSMDSPSPLLDAQPASDDQHHQDLEHEQEPQQGHEYEHGHDHEHEQEQEQELEQLQEEGEDAPVAQEETADMDAVPEGYADQLAEEVQGHMQDEQYPVDHNTNARTGEEENVPLTPGVGTPPIETSSPAIAPEDHSPISSSEPFAQQHQQRQYGQPKMYMRDVFIDHETGSVRVLVVDESPVQPKPFLGGYRNRASGREFHNASCQCAPPKVAKSGELQKEKFHRDAQTTKVVTRSFQTHREQVAQTGEKFNAAAGADRILCAKPYFTADELHGLRVEKAIILQSHVRAWFARRRTTRMRQELEERAWELAEHNDRVAKDENEHRQREIERRMHPKTKEDFKVLYQELEMWRLTETMKIKEATDLTSEEKSAALEDLFKRETALLQTIHRLKIAATKENRQQQIAQTMSAMASLKEWPTAIGETVSVETPFTIRARELADLYAGLKLSRVSLDERLDILLHVKWTVKEFDCQLTRELVDLIDREADLLNRGRPAASLESLRNRICNLFLQFIETPEFNPEAARFTKVPLQYLKRPQLEPIATNKRRTKL